MTPFIRMTNPYPDSPNVAFGQSYYSSRIFATHGTISSSLIVSHTLRRNSVPKSHTIRSKSTKTSRLHQQNIDLSINTCHAHSGGRERRHLAIQRTLSNAPPEGGSYTALSNACKFMLMRENAKGDDFQKSSRRRIFIFPTVRSHIRTYRKNNVPWCAGGIWGRPRFPFCTHSDGNVPAVVPGTANDKLIYIYIEVI